jgi:hypothetical protein
MALEMKEMALLNFLTELKLLKEDKKDLFVEYKEKVDIKALRAAFQIAKIRSKLGDSEVMLDQYLDEVAKKINV